MAGKNQKYTQEFKQTIVDLYHSGKTYNQIKEEYGISHNALANWIKQYSEVKIDDNTVLTAKQIKELQKRNAQLEEVFYEDKRLEIREILRKLCEWKGVKIIEGEVCPDHIHMLVSIPPKMSVSGFMGYLKGKSALQIFQKWGNMKFAYRNREFWCKGYYVDTAGKNTKAIKEYIANQLKQDRESDQLSLFDPQDPFMGNK